MRMCAAKALVYPCICAVSPVPWLFVDVIRTISKLFCAGAYLVGTYRNVSMSAIVLLNSNKLPFNGTERKLLEK